MSGFYRFGEPGTDTVAHINTRAGGKPCAMPRFPADNPQIGEACGRISTALCDAPGCDKPICRKHTTKHPASAPPRESDEPLMADEHGECPNCANPPHTGDCTRKRPRESAATEHPDTRIKCRHCVDGHTEHGYQDCESCGGTGFLAAAPQQTEEPNKD